MADHVVREEPEGIGEFKRDNVNRREYCQRERITARNESEVADDAI